MSEIATIAMSNVDKKTKEGETPVKLCNFVDVYRNWAITKDLIPTLMSATAKPQEIEKFTLSKGQVALTKDSETRDDIGIATYIADNMDNVLLGYHCAVLTPNSALVDSKYLNAYMHSNIVHKYFENNASGSGQRYTLSYNALLNIPVLLPDLELQKEIGQIFSNIDRKITLNRQINDNLEAMARQLYDYWFVQFDFPVENGKPYKSSGGKMVWNEELKKEIPINWNVERLGKRCKVLLGGTPDTKDEKLWGEGYSWLNSGEVAVFPILKSERQITQAGLDSSATVLATKGSVTLSITRYLRPSILAIDACINQSVVAIEENEFYKKEFLYPYIKAEVPILMSLRTGAQQPHINKETVENIKLLHPSNEIMDKYLRYTTPVYKEIVNLAQETENLTKQRDELLPLLMNGQVTVNYHLSLAHITPTTLAPLCTP